MNPSSSSGRRLGLPNWSAAFCLALLLLATAPAARAADYFLAPPGSTWCNGTANNNSLANPIPYVSATVANIIVSNPANPSDATVRLWFTTGEYLIPRLNLYTVPGTRRLFLSSTNGPVTLRHAVPTGNEGAAPSSVYNGPTWSSQLLLFNLDKAAFDHFEAHNLTLDANWPAWAATNTAASPGYVYGFVSGGLAVRATTGLVRGVRVRHCGSNGLLSHPYATQTPMECFPLFVQVPSFNFGANATNTWTVEDCEVSDFHPVRGGYATFIMVTTPNPAYSTNDPGPWQFYSNRVAVVRRCQVRGVGGTAGFAFGTAHSAGVSFQDNVAVNCYGGMNMDTLPIRNIDLTNSIFLDVSFLAFFGSPIRTSHSGATWYANYTNFTASDNAIRLSAVPLWQEYKSYDWRTNTFGTNAYIMQVTDPALPLGRFIPGSANGLRIMGTHLTWFERNRFTTRPLAQFYEPDPTNTALALWRPLERSSVQAGTGRWCDQDGTNVSSDIRCSSVAMSFSNLVALPLPPTNQLPALTNLADWPAGFTAGGRPGRVVPAYQNGRLAGVYEVQMTEPRLGNGVEVRARLIFHPSAMGGQPPAWTPGLRLVVLSGPNAGTAVQGLWQQDGWTVLDYWPETLPTGAGCDKVVVHTGTAPFDPDTAAWTAAEMNLGTVVRFERTPDVADDRRLCPGTLRLSRSGPTNANLSVVLEPVTSGVTRPAWPGTVYDYVLCTNQVGTTNWITVPYVNNRATVVIPAGAREVTVRVLPQAGDANQNFLEFETAYFQLVTNSAYAVAPPAAWVTTGPGDTAAVPLWDGARYRLYELNDSYAGGGQAAMSAELLAAVEQAKAAPRSTLQDVLAQPVGWPWQRSRFVAFGEPGENEPDSTMEVQSMPAVIGKAGRLQETLPGLDAAADPLDWRWQHFSRAQMDDAWLGDPAGLPPLTDLAESEPQSWTAEAQDSPAVMDSGYWSFSFSAAYDLNDLAAPFIAGNGTYWHSYLGRYISRGGRWEAPAYDRLRWAEVGGGADYPYIWGVGDAGGLVGSYAGRACYVAPGLTSYTTLPSLSAGGPGEALAIADYDFDPVLEAVIVGWSHSNTTPRPTRWQWSATNWVAIDLGAFETNNRPGYAYGANLANRVVVGKTQVTIQAGTNTLLAWRAFRTNGVLSAQHRALAELLPAPPDTEHRVTNYNSVANGIDAANNAVGLTEVVAGRNGQWINEPRAALWWAPSNLPTVLGALVPQYWDRTNPPARSEALAVAQGTDYKGETWLQIVGTGWLTPTGYPRASVLEAYPSRRSTTYLRNLNDPAETWIIQTGWTLVTAEDVNARGWIVGNGTYNGLQRGYVLVPQTAP